jgi:hypothetical protein
LDPQFLIGAAAADITGTFSSITPGFTTQTIGGNLNLNTVPEPAGAASLCAAVALMARRRSKAQRS